MMYERIINKIQQKMLESRKKFIIKHEIDMKEEMKKPTNNAVKGKDNLNQKK